jgi:hypothetical protein
MAEQETEQEANVSAFDEENMFNTDTFDDDREDQEDDDLNEFPDFSAPPKDEVEDVVEDTTVDNTENAEEEDEDDPDKINFDAQAESKDEAEIDLEAFNKKFNQSFKDQNELQEFMKEKKAGEDKSQEDQILSEAENQLSLLEPYLEMDSSGLEHKISDEDLMKAQFETIALQEKKDLNNEDVQLEIEEKLEELHDSGKFYKKANILRNNIQKTVDEYNKSKTTISEKRTAEMQAQEKASQGELQNEFVKFYSGKKFYGVDINKNTITDAYKKVTSGKFLEDLKTDKNAMAELALIATLKEEIFKKATGLTYSEGIKAVMDEYKSKDKGSRIAKAQKRGSMASAGGHKGLIDELLGSAPKKS